MTTHTTLEEARQAARANNRIAYIIEIEHRTEGRCYIGCLASMSTLAASLRRQPIAEIVRLVAQYDTRTEAEREAERIEMLRQCKCERCRATVDGNTAYHQQEWASFSGSRVRVTAYYCAACATLLTQIGAGEHTAMQERASERLDNTPYTKAD